MKFLMFFCFTLFHIYGQTVDNNLLVVYGHNSSLQSADVAKLSFSLTEYAPTLKEVTQKLHEKANYISDSLISIGLKKGNFIAESFSSGENNRDKPFLSSSKDFQSTIRINLIVDSLSLIDDYLIAISEMEIQNISRINYELKDDHKLKEKSRLLAIQDAKNKAEMYSENFNVRLGEIKYIEELIPYGSVEFYVPRPKNNSNINADIAFFRPGEVRIKNRNISFSRQFSRSSGVKVVYRLEK